MQLNDGSKKSVPNPSPFGRLAGRFVPAATLRAGGAKLQQSKLLARVALILTVCPLFPTASLARQGHIELAICAALCSVASVVTLLLLRRGIRPDYLGPIIPACLFATMAACSFVLGGIHAPVAQSLLLLPMLTWFLCGRAMGQIAVVIIVVTFLLLAWTTEPGSGPTVVRMVSLIVLNLLLVLIARAFYSVGHEAQAILDSTNTELRATNADLVDARDTAEKALKARSRFISLIGHELRTPLAGIIGMASLTLDGPLESGQRERVKTVHDAGQTLSRLLDDLLDFAKMDAGKLTLEAIEFNPRQLVASVVALMDAQARSKGLRLQHEVDPELPKRLQGDPARLRQVLLNLVGNALRFTHQGGVTIRMFAAEDAPASTGDDRIVAQFEVEDSGVGMTASDAARVFEPFTQAKSSTARKYGGTGLGLSICRELIGLMGGEIGVDSHLGEGSRFWFRIPLVSHESRRSSQDLNRTNNDTVDDASTLDSSELHRYAAMRILVAEDDLVSQKIIKAFLDRLQCQVDIVDNGQEAVEAVGRGVYNLVLMDCQMPILDGFDATSQIRALPSAARQTPIVAMTASALKEDRAQCIQAGMDEHLGKPIKRHELLAVLATHAREVGDPHRSQSPGHNLHI